MKKIVNFLSDGFIRLMLFCLFWLSFIIYVLVNENFKLPNFIYYLVIYIPLTILILKKSFYFANMLLLILCSVEILTSGIDIIKCILGFNINIVFTLIFSLLKFIMYVILIGYIILKLKTKENDELKNIFMAKIVLIVITIYFVFSMVNVIILLHNSKAIISDIFGFINTILLLLQEVVFLIICEKNDKLIKIGD